MSGMASLELDDERQASQLVTEHNKLSEHTVATEQYQESCYFPGLLALALGMGEIKLCLSTYEVHDLCCDQSIEKKGNRDNNTAAIGWMVSFTCFLDFVSQSVQGLWSFYIDGQLIPLRDAIQASDVTAIWVIIGHVAA